MDDIRDADTRYHPLLNGKAPVQHQCHRYLLRVDQYSEGDQWTARGFKLRLRIMLCKAPFKVGRASAIEQVL